MRPHGPFKQPVDDSGPQLLPQCLNGEKIRRGNVIGDTKGSIWRDRPSGIGRRFQKDGGRRGSISQYEATQPDMTPDTCVRERKPAPT